MPVHGQGAAPAGPSLTWQGAWEEPGQRPGRADFDIEPGARLPKFPPAAGGRSQPWGYGQELGAGRHLLSPKNTVLFPGGSHPAPGVSQSLESLHSIWVLAPGMLMCLCACWRLQGASLGLDTLLQADLTLQQPWRDVVVLMYRGES